MLCSLTVFTLSASFLILKQSFLSIKETHFVSFFIISQHVPPILWSPLWNFAWKSYSRKGTLSRYVLYRLEHHRSPKGLILRDNSCQILYWWPTFDYIFQLRTSFLAAHPTSETNLRLPGSFACPCDKE